MTDTRPHFWFQIIEDNDSLNETLCAENLKDNVLYYYGAYENEIHSIFDYDFEEYDNFYIAPNSAGLFDSSLSCFVIEENEYNEIMSIMGGVVSDLEVILEDEPNLQYRISNIFNYPDGEGYIGEYISPIVSWNINNKTVKNLQIGNKIVQTIERVSDGAIIYQKI